MKNKNSQPSSEIEPKVTSKKNFLTSTIFWKRLAGITLAILVVIVALGAWLFVDSTKAISQYREAIGNQYSNVAAGHPESDDVVIRDVFLGSLINPKYKTVKSLANDYQKIMIELRSYMAIKENHNDLVNKYNNGVENAKFLNGEMMTTVNRYLSSIKKYYPNQTERISALNELSSKMTESTTFNDISDQVNQILHSNDSWLSSLRDQANSNVAKFQNQINR